MNLLLTLLLASASPAQASDLDLVFLLDTTGSMSGELSEAKNRVRQIAEALREADPDRTLRVGVVAYRDRTDVYITQVSDLNSDIDVSFRALAGLTANGGGDGPEDVLSGMHSALQEISWSTDPDTQRQVFLIGDAPPHLDYIDHHDPDALLAQAREMGVVFHAIGCRSLSGSGRDFFRRVAYETEGRYQHIGRVSLDQGGLADAMISTLVREPDSPLEPLSAYPHSDQPPDASHSLESSGVFVRLGNWWTPRELEDRAEESEVCLLTTLVPDGLALAAPPTLGTNEQGVTATLELISGAGSVQSWELERCLPIDTAVTVRFEESR
jgi:uncharacterized protein YegL